MPGKVNPTQAEALTMVCAHVMGNDVAIGIAGASGHFELNVFKPMLIHNLLESVELLADACDSFRENCVVGHRAEPRDDRAPRRQLAHARDGARAAHRLRRAPRRSRRARYEKNVTLKEAALASGLVTAEQFDAHVRPEEMVHP